MARFTSKLDVRVHPDTLAAINWYAKAADVPTADVVRYFLPGSVPDPAGDPDQWDPGEVKNTVELIRALHDQDLERLARATAPTR